MRRIFFSILIAVFALLLGSCSQNSVTQPDDITQPNAQADSNQAFLGHYTVNLDPETQTGTITPNRELSAHMNAKEYLLGWPCGNCLQVKNIQFLPDNIVECDIEVTHPTTDPMFTVFDLRVIGIFPPDLHYYGAGVSIAIQNNDGLTALWDNPTIPGYVNSFIAYNKGVARRPFAPGDVFTETFVIQMPLEAFNFDIAVDASWAPNDGVTFPMEMNSFEVINLDGEISAGLTNIGGSAEIIVDMYDYQGIGTISQVVAYCDDLFNAPVNLSFESGSGSDATYSAMITNQKNAPVGTYHVLLRVIDTESANYSYDFSRLALFGAEVYQELVDVEITLSEDDDYKTIGNYYDFDSFDGVITRTMVDYLDYDGPWDFTGISFNGDAQRSMLSPSDPEVALFTNEFPGREHFVKNDGQFGIGSGLYYQAEKHDYAKNKCTPLGFYEMDMFNGSVVFAGTIDGFPYPFNSGTSFNRKFGTGGIFEMVTILYDTNAVGMGLCTITLSGGTTKSALQLRTIIEMKVFGYEISNALVYEWFDDDGNMLVTMVALNNLDEDPNWNTSTFEIIGEGGIAVLESMYRQ